MTYYVNDLVQQYRRSGVLIDTNLLLLFLVGLYDRNQISQFKATAKFFADDFDLLVLILDEFDKIITTPNILTEVNSFANKWADTFKPGFFATFAQAISNIKLVEVYIPSMALSATTEFIRFGLTDTAILQISLNKYLVLTDDFRLSQYLLDSGIDAINFNHLRTYLG